jgi:hypothetical protein
LAQLKGPLPPMGSRKINPWLQSRKICRQWHFLWNILITIFVCSAYNNL